MKTLKQILIDMKENNQDDHWNYDWTDEWSLSVKLENGGIEVELSGKGGKGRRYIALVCQKGLGYFYKHNYNLSHNAVESVEYYNDESLGFAGCMPVITPPKKITEDQMLYCLNDGLKRMSKWIPYESITKKDWNELIKKQ
ncbi:hypothetical protein [Persephonella sp.]